MQQIEIKQKSAAELRVAGTVRIRNAELRFKAHVQQLTNVSPEENPTDSFWSLLKERRLLGTECVWSERRAGHAPRSEEPR